VISVDSIIYYSIKLFHGFFRGTCVSG